MLIVCFECRFGGSSTTRSDYPAYDVSKAGPQSREGNVPAALVDHQKDPNRGAMDFTTTSVSSWASGECLM